MRVNRRNKTYWKPILSGLMVVLGIGLLSFHKRIIDSSFDQILTLKPNTFVHNLWKDPEVPILIYIYFFNWTNPEDLMNTSVKPKFEEVGPLFITETVHRWNVTLHENNTLSYRNLKTFYYHQEKSSATLEDNITFLNMLPVIASEKSRNWNFFLKKGLSIALYETPHHLTKTIREWLFEGFEDPLLNTASYLPIGDFPEMEKFAWFYKRNHSASYEGWYNVGSGLGNTTIGKTYNWNFRNKSDYEGPCSDVQANGEIYPQRIKKEKLDLFFPDFCRKVPFEYNGTSVWNGIEVYIFIAGISFLDNGKYNPENSCLCNRKCLNYGVISYSQCKFGIPAYLSLPHFNMADPKYRNDIEGMNPNDNHKMELWINPRTGIIVKMDMNIQLNVILEPNPSITKFNNVPEVMFPVLWFKLVIDLDMKLIIMMNVLLHLDLIVKVISAILIVLGTFLYIRFMIKFYSRKERKTNYTENCQSENLRLMTQKDFRDKA